ncbi:hypothetical protein KDH_78200 [Dictyobacter sp. S3.2.2.5]|uniref:Uncharacterized protein n=1 Tax=Dictyobacter halimunensis TaxID=3026934 RepID=A0ABQ6G381_9CHLR|nr:hypothetical protein KDH_78200 [Dictyobacter sp. S3.2.2.5]
MPGDEVAYGSKPGRARHLQMRARASLAFRGFNKDFACGLYIGDAPVP